MINNLSIPQYKLSKGQNLAFSGKKFVQLSLFGEKYLVPKAVADVRRSVKYVFAEDKNNCYPSNAVNLKDNMFLGISHFMKYLNKNYEINLGKINNSKESTCSVNAVKKHSKNIKLDLSIFKVEMPKFWQVTKSNPSKSALKLPEPGEDVFIVGYHPEFSGPKVIPAKYTGRCNPNSFINEYYGNYADYFEINSEVLKNRIDPSCLSGAAIVNKKGELIGLQGKAIVDAGNNNMSEGKLFGIDIWTIQKYLKDNNISV